MSDIILKALLGLLPVLMFLGALVYFDTFKLVLVRTVMLTVIGGIIAAILAYFINTEILTRFDISFTRYSHFIAPPLEEALKAMVIFVLLMTNRIGFTFDAAILGFAAGAGFALAENMYYLQSHADMVPAVWGIRGFGTAIMHGAATAMLAMTGHIIAMRSGHPRLWHAIPGFILASVFHGAFNYFLDYPVASTLVMMVLFPIALYALLSHDQKVIHNWLLEDYARHRQVLRDIRSGDFMASEAGQYIDRMKKRFGQIKADRMMRYVRLHAELVVDAEKLMRLREAGGTPKISDAVKSRLTEFNATEEQIGKTALMALREHLHFTHQELWEIYMLEREAGFKNSRAH